MNLKVIMLALIMNLPLFAQLNILPLPPKDQYQTRIQFLSPNFDLRDDESFSTMSGNYVFEINLPIDDDYNLIGSIVNVEYSYKLDNFFGSTLEFNNSGLGNVNLGIQYRLDEWQYWTFSVTIPTADRDAGFGIFAEGYQYSRYRYDWMAVQAIYNRAYPVDDDLDLGLAAGPDVLFNTGDGDLNDDVLFLVKHAAYVHYRFEAFHMGLAYTGNLNISSDINEFMDRFDSALDLGIAYQFDQLRPGVFAMYFLNSDFRFQGVNVVFGFNLDISF